MAKKPFSLLLIILISGCIGNCGSNDMTIKSEVNNHKYHTLTCGYANGWELEVGLNGIPVHDSEKSSGTLGVDCFVVNGSNTLTVIATQIDRKEIWDPLVITLWRGDEENAYKEKLVDVKIEPQEDGYRFSESYEFNAVMPLKWTWQTASVIGELSDSDRKRVLEEVRSFYDAIKSKDVQKCLRATEVVVEDLGKYGHKSQEEAVREMRNRFESIFSDANFSPRLSKEEEILIEVGKRVVLVSGARDELRHKNPLIILIPHSGSVDEKSSWSQGVVFKELALSKVDGRWRIIWIK